MKRPNKCLLNENNMIFITKNHKNNKKYFFIYNLFIYLFLQNKTIPTSQFDKTKKCFYLIRKFLITSENSIIKFRHGEILKEKAIQICQKKMHLINTINKLLKNTIKKKDLSKDQIHEHLEYKCRYHNIKKLMINTLSTPFEIGPNLSKFFFRVPVTHFTHFSSTCSQYTSPVLKGKFNHHLSICGNLLVQAENQMDLIEKNIGGSLTKAKKLLVQCNLEIQNTYPFLKHKNFPDPYQTCSTNLKTFEKNFKKLSERIHVRIWKECFKLSD